MVDKNIRILHKLNMDRKKRRPAKSFVEYARFLGCDLQEVIFIINYLDEKGFVSGVDRYKNRLDIISPKANFGITAAGIEYLDGLQSGNYLWLSYSDSGIVLNEKYLISNPNSDSHPGIFADYLFNTQNKKLLYPEIEKSVGFLVDGRKVSKILDQLKFTEKLLNLFFIKDRFSLQFINPVTKDRAKNFKTTKSALVNFLNDR